MLVTLQPGRSYTIIAAAPPGQVSQLEVKLLAPPLFKRRGGPFGRRRQETRRRSARARR